MFSLAPFESLLEEVEAVLFGPVEWARDNGRAANALDYSDARHASNRAK
jgi:hypothetical protein